MIHEKSKLPEPRARRAAASISVLFLVACTGGDQQTSQPTLLPLDARLAGHVRRITEDWPRRNSRNPETLREVADYIAEQLAGDSPKARRQHFTVAGNQYTNVRVLLGPPSGPRVVVGAHYDVAGDGPGADDNASGAAALIEIGRSLRSRSLKTTVELVAYSLEEPPFFRTENMGSAKHAQLLKDQGVDVRAMLSLEMLGYYSAGKGSQRYPLDAMRGVYPDQGDFIAVVGRLQDCPLVDSLKAALTRDDGLGVERLCAPEFIELIGLSDHRNYWSRGYTAVMITDTAFLRNDNYHELSDTWDTLDYAKMAQLVEVLVEAITELANASAE